MTEEFKKQLLNFILGQMPNEYGIEKEKVQYIDDVSIPENGWDKVIPKSWQNFKFEELIEVKNSDKLVLYGGYTEYNTKQVRGIIVVLKRDLTPLKTFYQYDNGTYLRYILCMTQDDEGNFIAVDSVGNPQDFQTTGDNKIKTGEKRFIMLNNFTIDLDNSYTLIMRKSYIFGNEYTNFYCKQIFKNPNSSHYVMIGKNLGEQNGGYNIRIIELKINTGSSNEWKKWDSSQNTWHYGTSYVEFMEDKFFIEVILTRNTLDNRKIGLWKKDFNEENLNYIEIFETPYFAVIDTNAYKNQAVFLNKNEVYFIINNQRWGIQGEVVSKYIGLYHTNLVNNITNVVYEHYLGEYDFCQKENMFLCKNENNIYVLSSKENEKGIYFQRLKNDLWEPLHTSMGPILYDEERIFFYVKDDYNLINMYIFDYSDLVYIRNSIVNIKEIYNANNYNGDEYINYMSLIANSSVLYSDNKAVFARNLYNKVVNDNTTISTIEIPNNYINDILIDKKELVSQTNMNIIEDSESFIKNIYETVYLNFINTLSIINRNNPSNQILNEIASSSLNEAINIGYSYEYARLTKVRINYLDGEKLIKTLFFERIGDKKALLKFEIYVDKPIKDIELISEDTTIIYQTINLDVELKKYYAIEQELEVM